MYENLRYEMSVRINNGTFYYHSFICIAVYEYTLCCV